MPRSCRKPVWCDLWHILRESCITTGNISCNNWNTSNRLASTGTASGTSVGKIEKWSREVGARWIVGPEPSMDIRRFSGRTLASLRCVINRSMMCTPRTGRSLALCMVLWLYGWGLRPDLRPLLGVFLDGDASRTLGVAYAWCRVRVRLRRQQDLDLIAVPETHRSIHQSEMIW